MKRLALALVLVAALASADSAFADGARITNRLQLVDVLRISPVIFTARVSRVAHVFAERRAYGRLQRYIERFRIQVTLVRSIRDPLSFERLRRTNRGRIWLERHNPMRPGKWVIIRNAYPESYGLSAAKPGDELIVYAPGGGTTGEGRKAVLRLGYVDALGTLPAVERLLRSGADKQPPVRRHPSCPAQRPLFTPKGCESLSHFRAQRPCPSGASWKWRARAGVELELYCEDATRRPHGPTYHWDGNGRLKRIQSYRQGALDGVVRSYHPNGKLQLRAHYRAGRKDGLYEAWHQNGQLASRTTYKNDLWDGAGTLYDYRGRVTARLVFRTGTGTITRYLADKGTRYTEVSYRDGKRTGPLRSWHDNGRISLLGRYDDNQRDGRWLRFDNSGRFSGAECYRKGKTLWKTNVERIGCQRRCL